MNENLILSIIGVIFIGGIAGYLGSLMIVKRMGLLGGPLGHLALPGVALALVFDFNVFLGAFLTIVLGSILVWLLEARTKAPPEALTGLVFVFGVSLGFLILPFSNEHQLEEALIGDITKISLTETVIVFLLSIVIFFAIKKIYSKLLLIEISEDLAKVQEPKIKKYYFIYLASIACITALTVKIVGGLLPVALIVIPSLTSRNLFRSFKAYSFGSLLIGILICFSGLILSLIFNLPSGLIIILSGISFFLISLIFGR